jgi:hypothetical protein
VAAKLRLWDAVYAKVFIVFSLSPSFGMRLAARPVAAGINRRKFDFRTPGQRPSVATRAIKCDGRHGLWAPFCPTCNIPEDEGAAWQPSFEPAWKLPGPIVEFASILKLLTILPEREIRKMAGAPRAATTFGDLGVVLTLSG